MHMPNSKKSRNIKCTSQTPACGEGMVRGDFAPSSALLPNIGGPRAPSGVAPIGAAGRVPGASASPSPSAAGWPTMCPESSSSKGRSPMKVAAAAWSSPGGPLGFTAVPPRFSGSYGGGSVPARVPGSPRSGELDNGWLRRLCDAREPGTARLSVDTC